MAASCHQSYPKTASRLGAQRNMPEAAAIISSPRQYGLIDPDLERPSHESRAHVDDATLRLRRGLGVHHPRRAAPRQTETRENGTVQAIDTLSLVLNRLAPPRRRPCRLSFSVTMEGRELCHLPADPAGVTSSSPRQSEISAPNSH